MMTRASIAPDVNTGNFGHMFPAIMVKSVDGTVYLVTSTGRESDDQTYGGPLYGINPEVFSSVDGGQTFDQGQPLFDQLTYNGYNAPSGALDAVALADGSLVIGAEGGEESPREGIVV